MVAYPERPEQLLLPPVISAPYPVEVKVSLYFCANEGIDKANKKNINP
jgi:hypothetical protein